MSEATARAAAARIVLDVLLEAAGNRRLPPSGPLERHARAELEARYRLAISKMDSGLAVRRPRGRST